MARFRYIAKNMQGKTSRGVRDALTESALSQQLRQEGLFLVEAKDAAGGRKHRRLKAKEIASFCKELSNLLGSGISLVRALDIISELEGIKPELRAVYERVLADVRKGISLSEALETQECFPELMIGMVRSGEGSGNLDLVMERLATHYEKDNRLSQQVRSAMTYPMILLVMCVAVVILIVTFILPQFRVLFDEMDSLPAPTQFLVDFSDFLIHRWYIAILVVMLFVSLLRVIVSFYSVRRLWDYMKVRMPVFGKLLKVIYTARFARTLSSLYSSGMPISHAIVTAGETVGNRYIQEQFEEATAMVYSGVPLSEALKSVDGFLNKLPSAIQVGEESGRLDSMLDSIALSLEQEAEEATKRLVTLLEPMLICFMAFVVGFIMIAVLMPILQSYAAIEAYGVCY